MSSEGYNVARGVFNYVSSKSDTEMEETLESDSEWLVMSSRIIVTVQASGRRVAGTRGGEVVARRVTVSACLAP